MLICSPSRRFQSCHYQQVGVDSVLMLLFLICKELPELGGGSQFVVCVDREIYVYYFKKLNVV